MLIKSSQIESNLRRTASKGYISLLNQEQLEHLALKYFGIKDEDGNIIGYQCPYSGEVYTDYRNIVLEHIIPIDSKGGTVLFNCIPTSSEVNKVSEKGAKHLITWWINSKYWDANAPQRLEKLVNYMLEAYDIFEEYTLEEIDYDYDDLIINQNDADLSTTSKLDQMKQKLDAKMLEKISYYSFLNDCINVLNSFGIEVSKYRKKLDELKNIGCFDNINKYSLIQNILKNIIKIKLNLENRSELTIVAKINVIELANSMINYNTEDEIKKEIIRRIENIENILNLYEVDIISYFQDIKNCSNILFKSIDEITKQDIDNLIENIRISNDNKFRNLVNSINKQEKIDSYLAVYLSQIKVIDFRDNKFCISLNEEQLEVLAKSKNQLLYKTYLEILMKSYRYGIYNTEKIIFTLENQKAYEEIIKYYSELETYNVDSIDDLDINVQIQFYEKYKTILEESSLIKLINLLEKNPNDVPSRGKEYSCEENEIAKILNRLTTCREKGFNNLLSKIELEYIANSENQVLRWIYYERYMKSRKYNIPFDCEIVPQKVRRPVKQHNIFDEMLEWFSKNPGERIPSSLSDNPREKMIGDFYQRIKNVYERNNKHFYITLSQKELSLLANSSDERLLRLYAEIYDKAKKNEISLSYDVEPKRVPSIINNRFNELLNWFSKNPGLMPSTISDDDYVKRIGKIFQSIKTMDGHGRAFFQMNLSKNELYILATTSDDVLKKLYEEILFKSIKYSVYGEKDMIYTDDNIRLSKLYKDYFDEIKKNEVADLSELPIQKQIEIINKFPNVDYEKSYFIKLLEWLKDNDGTPKKETSKAKNLEETKVGSFWWRISNVINKIPPTFKTMLTKEELIYMFNSSDSRLKDGYYRILSKAIKNEIVINYYPKDVLHEIMFKNREYYNKIKASTSVDINFEDVSEDIEIYKRRSA